MAVTRYNPKDCVVVIVYKGKTMYVTQLGEDPISFEKEEAFFETKVGALGDVIKSENNNSIHKLTLSIQPTSPQRGDILALAGIKDTLEIWVTNKALNERFGGTQANIQELPEISRGAEAEDMEIVFTVFDGELGEIA